jgi:hypothetical protein
MSTAADDQFYAPHEIFDFAGTPRVLRQVLAQA